MNMILTSECENCIYGTIIEDDKSHIKVKCTQKGKEYYYGQRIPCNCMIKNNRKVTNE